jgi:hypothetical protein
MRRRTGATTGSRLPTSTSETWDRECPGSPWSSRPARRRRSSLSPATGRTSPATRGELRAPWIRACIPSAPRRRGTLPFRRASSSALPGGALAVLAACVFGVETIVASNTSQSECLSTNVCGAAGYRKNQTARADATIANVLLPVGLATTGAGLLLLLMSPSGAARPSTLAAQIGPGRAAVGFQTAW